MKSREKMQALQESLMRELSGTSSLEADHSLTEKPGAVSRQANSALSHGFNVDRVQAAAAALKRKRHQAITRCWPAMMQSRCYAHDTLFAEFINANPGVHAAGPIQDGASFASFLHARGELDAEAHNELKRFQAMTAREQNILYKFASNLLSLIAWRT